MSEDAILLVKVKRVLVDGCSKVMVRSVGCGAGEILIFTYTFLSVIPLLLEDARLYGW